MSGTLPFYIKMGAVAAIDLWVGSTLAFIVDKFFHDKFTVNQADIETRWKHDLLWASVQAAVTVLSADQLRNMLYPPNFEDPTGGVVFMMTILRQPSFWEKVDFVVMGATRIIPEVLKQETVLMEEKVIEPGTFQNSLLSMATRTPKPNVNLAPSNRTLDL